MNKLKSKPFLKLFLHLSIPFFISFSVFKIIIKIVYQSFDGMLKQCFLEQETALSFWIYNLIIASLFGLLTACYHKFKK